MKTFEERLERLEQISESFRNGSIPLKESVALFEEGIRLAKGLEKELSRIEGKIEILMNQPVESEESPRLELFPELNEDG